MAKAGPIATIFALLGTGANFFAMAYSSGIKEVLEGDPQDVEEAIGDIFAFMILLGLWIGLLFVAFVLLLLGKLFYQHIIITVANLLLTGAQVYYAVIPVLGLSEGTAQERLISTIGISILPIIIIAMSLAGIKNRNAE